MNPAATAASCVAVQRQHRLLLLLLQLKLQVLLLLFAAVQQRLLDVQRLLLLQGQGRRLLLLLPLYEDLCGSMCRTDKGVRPNDFTCPIRRHHQEPGAIHMHPTSQQCGEAGKEQSRQAGMKQAMCGGVW
jgi:hypothetical protein